VSGEMKKKHIFIQNNARKGAKTKDDEESDKNKRKWGK
jgi:hypothetical protein